MGREKKSEREKRQAAGFLRDHVAYDDLECVNPDPPDIRVWHNGSAVLDLELTEYHIDDEKVGISIRWAEKLWPKVDELRRKDNTLANIHGFIIFSNSKLPGLRKNEADQFASELVKLAAQVGPMLGDAGQLKISFMPRTVADAQPVIGMGWSLYPTEDWQIISQHISAITFSKFLAAWTRWQCPQTETGYTSRRPETFRDIFDEKDKKIREALPGAGSPGHGVPLWLVIISDTLTDMTSHLFPSNEADRVELFRAIRESGYDLANSPFTEVWLYSDFHQQKLRLHPADIR